MSHIHQLDLFDATQPLRKPEHADALPKTAQYLVEIIGLDATIDLVKEEGGNELKIPGAVAGTSHMWERLVEIIGPTAAEALVRRCADTVVYVPTCAATLRRARNRDIIRRYDAGEPFDSIRRSYKISRSYLFRLLKRPV